MDPATIALVFGAAKSAFSAIQQGIKFGKDLQSMTSDVAKLYGSVAKLTQAAADPPKPKLFSKLTAEEIALDAVQKRRQAAEWAEQVKNEFVAVYGLKGWDEVQREIIRVRKEQRILEEQRKRDAAQMKEDFALLGAIALVAVVLVVGLFTLAILIGG
jgi:hypothetical protein